MNDIETKNTLNGSETVLDKLMKAFNINVLATKVIVMCIVSALTVGFLIWITHPHPVSQSVNLEDKDSLQHLQIQLQQKLHKDVLVAVQADPGHNALEEVQALIGENKRLKDENQRLTQEIESLFKSTKSNGYLLNAEVRETSQSVKQILEGDKLKDSGMGLLDPSPSVSEQVK